MPNHKSLLTVPARLAARAQERPNDPAFTLVGVGKLSFGDWEHRSTAAARGLLQQGVGPGDRVTLVADLPGLLSFAVSYVAVQKAGGTPVPVPRAAGLHHLEHVHQAAHAVGFIGDSTGATLGGWRANLADLETYDSATSLTVDVVPTDVAEILYTSGTTAKPKGVLVSHENLLFTHTTSRPDKSARIVVHALSPGTQVGQGLLVQALDGTPHQIVALPLFEPGALLTAVTRHDATHVVVVPVMALSLIQYGVPDGVDVSSVRLVRNTSAPIAPAALAKLAELFPEAGIEDHYSTTQAWPARTRLRFDPSRPGSVGRNQGPAQIRIVDEAGNALGIGTPGYVEMTLPGAPPRRYIDGEDDKDGTFRPDGWIRTGDLAYLDEDGYLYLVDRAGDSVNTGGLKISTLVAERVIQAFPGVIEAAVVGLPSPTLGEYPVAAIRTAGPLNLDELGAFLDDRLGSLAPTRLILVDDYPRTGLGKVIKRELRTILAGNPDAEPTGTGNNTDDLLTTLREFWTEALGVDPVDHVSFMAQGGNSLSAAHVVGRIREELGRAVGHRALFNATNLTDFADRVRAAPLWVPDELGPITHVEPLSSESVPEGHS